MALQRPIDRGTTVDRAKDRVAVALLRLRHRRLVAGRRPDRGSSRRRMGGPPSGQVRGDGFNPTQGEKEDVAEASWGDEAMSENRANTENPLWLQLRLRHRGPAVLRFVATLTVGVVVGVGVTVFVKTDSSGGSRSQQAEGATASVAPLAELPLITAAPSPSTATAPTTTMVIVVHAAGAFRRPGVYLFPLGARVDDLLNAAGGANENAAMEVLNLAAPLADGQRVWVPIRGQSIPPIAPPEIASDAGSSLGVPGGNGGSLTGRAGPGGTGSGAIFDLNLATVEQLDDLPGVGPSTAAAIVEYRTQHKRFGSVGELLNVRGIGEAKLSALRSRVKV